MTSGEPTTRTCAGSTFSSPAPGSLGVSLPPTSLRQRIEDAGGHLVWFHGLRTWTLKSANYRTHRKLLVVDGRIAIDARTVLPGQDDQLIAALQGAIRD